MSSQYPIPCRATKSILPQPERPAVCNMTVSTVYTGCRSRVSSYGKLPGMADLVLLQSSHCSCSLRYTWQVGPVSNRTVKVMGVRLLKSAI